MHESTHDAFFPLTSAFFDDYVDALAEYLPFKILSLK